MASYKQADKNPKGIAVNPHVLKSLTDMFGAYLHVDIIKSVGLNCNWHLESACNILAGFSSNVANKKIVVKKKGANTSNINSVAYIEDEDSDADVVIENETSTPNPVSYRTVAKQPGKFTKKVVPKKMPNKSKKELEYERIRDSILTGAKVLVILRGLPGSGKSYLAKLLVASTVGEDHKRFVFSTDDYFLVNNQYLFNPSKLAEAHLWNQQKVSSAMRFGISPVIVDNTNTQMWEMKIYAEFAVQFGYFIEIIEPLTPWLYNFPELCRRNIHNIPTEKLRDMLERYDRTITVKSLMTTYKLHYKAKSPPQPRMYPPIKKHISNLVNVSPSFIQPSKKKEDKSASLYAPVLAQTLQNLTITEATGAKKKRKKKNKESFEMIKSESVQNLVKDESDSSGDEDERSYDMCKFDSCNDLNTNDVFYKKQNMSFANLNCCKEYVLVMPDKLIFQKSQWRDDSEKENIDLINFNDTDNQKEPTEFKSDLICLETDKNDAQNVEPLIDFCTPKITNDFSKIDLNAWGTSTDALISWEIVDKQLNKNDSAVPQAQREVYKEKSKPVLVDGCTNTSSGDFNLINDPGNAYKVLPTCNRIINDVYAIPLLSPPPKVLMLDKGTMTNKDEVFTHTCNKERQHFRQLKGLFPHIKDDDLKDIFEKCLKNVDWTVDLLLDTTHATDTVIIKDTDADNECSCSAIHCLPTDTPMEEQLKNIPPSIKHKPIKKSAESTKEELIMLQKQIYEKVDINRSHYTPKLLALRKKRKGLSDDKPSCSTHENTTLIETDEMFTDEEPSSEEETIEMNFGTEVVRQLEENYGCPDVTYPEGLQPVMQLPISLARQLYAYWLESVFQQMERQTQMMESMIQEDADFAKKLQEQEASQTAEAKVPDLQEIMDMEIALAIYRADQDQWKKDTPDNMAIRMKRQKLFELFPGLDKGVLTEILQAHGNSFDQTVEVLCTSTGTSIEQVNHPDKQKELLEKAKSEYLQSNEASASTSVEKSVLLDDTDVISKQKNANFFREQANHHLNMRTHLYNKAQEAFRTGKLEVASYYSNMAKLHGQKYEAANSQAAYAFIALHSLNNNSKTLDLHFLYVKEAEEALDLFLDNQISKLTKNKRRHDSVFVITGRGLHSKGGISHIKPAVKRKLRERNLKYIEINPGLIKIYILQHSMMMNEM